MVGVLGIISNAIPESQKKVLRKFYQVRDNAELALFEKLERQGVLPVQLGGRLIELRKAKVGDKR